MAGAAAGSPSQLAKCIARQLVSGSPPLVLERLVGNAECHVRHRGWRVECDCGTA